MSPAEKAQLLDMGAIALVFVVILLGLYFFYLNSKKPQKKQRNEGKDSVSEDQDQGEKKKVEEYGRFQGVLTRESIKEFMEFDEIVDNMIVRKNRDQYIMVLQCNGVNYDLMSEQEKISVEQGFVQFLNTLRFPIQLYIQSRTLNLVDIIAEYKARIDEFNEEVHKLDAKIQDAINKGNRALQEKLEFERRRKLNVLEYGYSITDYVEKLGSNKNILQQKTYVVVSYYASEIGVGTDKYSKEELYNMCFSELYTRCQNISSALNTSQVTCSILDSEQLAELLYIAYNRDESEVLQLSKMVNAQYDSLYSSGKDVLDKKKEKLDREISIDAIDVATASLLKADKLRQLEILDQQMEKNKRVEEKALELLDTYSNQLDGRVYDIAKSEVKKTIKKRQDEEAAKNGTAPAGDAKAETTKRIIRKKSDSEE
ncbi:MAG: hypothetical protein IKN74_05330 [Clostridia bacterium]|nr:hypothetical protein [Clostridia bacterium]